MNVHEIAERLSRAGRLDAHTLCVYGADEPPAGSVPAQEQGRCVARAIYELASTPGGADAIHHQQLDGRCCPGGQAWCGFQPFRPMLKHFLSTGTPSFRNGKAEHLLASPELADARLASAGRITAPGRTIVIQRASTFQYADGGPEVLSFLVFGGAEQVRNLCSLAYFGLDSSVNAQMPWGPSCASFVSYPAGMIEHGPQGQLVLGPTDPTTNRWFPPEQLSLGIPYERARAMALQLDDSFIGKLPAVAYPARA
jgi:hypothetical protein